MIAAFLIRNVELAAGAPRCDVLVRDGRIAAIGCGLSGEEALDARGGALLPGLADHHIHILALAAACASIDVEDAASMAALAAMVKAAAAKQPDGAWLRVIGYHERIGGALTRDMLDALAPRHKLRVQHQSGVLWMLNSLAIAALGDCNAAPPCVETDAAGAPTGRIWRGDAWLRERIGAAPPDLAAAGARLASFGVTALTDASVNTTDASAALMADAHQRGALPQRLRLMSGGTLRAPDDGAYRIGEVKLLFDEASLPDINEVGAAIASARAQGRAVAAHCVTASELAFTLAAFEAFDAPPRSRVEHGSVIRHEAIAALRARNLTVVMQPSLVHRRGDRYLDDTPAAEHVDLYRCASLRAAGVRVALSSDAPYGSPDPWLAIAAAAQRRTASGRAFGVHEAIAARDALAAFLTPLDAPGGPARRLEVGADADMCLLWAPLGEALANPSAEQVAATWIGGRLVFRAA